MGDKRFLRTIFNQAKAKSLNYFNDYLEHLFYEALAIERKDSYFVLFDCRIPFLNGGLFEPVNDYNWRDFGVLIPNELFSNNERTPEGDIGSGILDVFDRYNFTVREDEDLEKEVAVDPEMLGKVFENLLEVNDRKSKGAFYTPREIVHYMCQESLINYLYNKLNTLNQEFIEKDQKVFFGFLKKQPELTHNVLEEHIKKDDLSDFIRYGDMFREHDKVTGQKEEQGRHTSYKAQIPQSIRVYAKEIDDAL